MTPLAPVSFTTFDLEKIIAVADSLEASDIHLSPGMPIFFRVHGKLMPQAGIKITDQMMNDWAHTESAKVQNDLKTQRQSDFSMMMKSGIRLRANAFSQQRGISLVLRIIRSKAVEFDVLGLPSFVRDKVRQLDHGMVLCVGPTGQGKSTTLSAIVQDKINTEDLNIITVEDPIEYVYDIAEGQTSIVSQREIGNNVASFPDGIRAALREDPDLLLVGEMRDYTTISAAITMAETGHLLLSTLHANTGAETISRIIDSFPADQQNQVRTQLALNLKMVISQRLLPSTDGKRVLAYEIMTNNYAVATKIRDNKINEISQVFEVGFSTGEMISFERCLAYLYKTGKITKEVAFDSAIEPNALQLLLEDQ